MPSPGRHCLAFLLVLLCLGSARADEGEDRWIEVLEDKKLARDARGQRDRTNAIRKLGGIGTPKAARALLPTFEDPFVHLKDHAVSAWIKMLKGRHAADVQTWMTQRPLFARDPAVRIGAATALGLTSGKEIENPLQVALKKEKDPQVLVALCRAVLQLRETPELKGAILTRFKHKDGAAVFALTEAAVHTDGKEAVKPLQAVLRHRAGLARAGAILALHRLEALTPKQLEAALGDDDPEPLMAVAEALAFDHAPLAWPDEGKAVLERLLASPHWRVRAAAVQASLRIWRKEIVDLLIARLGQEQGRLRDDIQRALETFTGRHIGDDPDLWRAWWIQVHNEFTPGDAPKRDRAGNVPFRPAGSGKPEGMSETVAFFDVPLRTKRLAFVFDLSGSMKDPTHDGAEQTKIELLQEEVERVLRSLPADVQFDIYVYRYPSDFPPKPKLTRALGKPQAASKSTVDKAVRWIRQPKQAPKGWGAFYEPLATLLEEDVDTVVLLSDGRPSRGIYDRDFRILQEFPRVNRFRRLAVNTVLVGSKGADRKFMESLAEATGGRFREAAGK